MGLLGKKWGPPPEATRVNFSDEGSKTRNTTGRKAVGFAAPEPTVTLATKEALADVFGMYNSPDRSQRYGPVAGSKHAPVRKIEPITPMSLHAPFRAATSNENADASKTPSKLAKAIWIHDTYCAKSCFPTVRGSKCDQEREFYPCTSTESEIPQRFLAQLLIIISSQFKPYVDEDASEYFTELQVSSFITICISRFCSSAKRERISTQNAQHL